ncbi:hypothetical protein [Aureimonas glaciei]|uniref:Uncharacterized protein n=1 Tax=Aureimonas glaciei TaxID=1776957 RepID=A0A916Y1Z0_9HYPH|nr:hypothetical protein [Aureimonas glaciei]GGD26207.1 hypothetical protein GCM10011335_31590 [Aureimonas glaciei]
MYDDAKLDLLEARPLAMEARPLAMMVIEMASDPKLHANNSAPVPSLPSCWLQAPMAAKWASIR